MICLFCFRCPLTTSRPEPDAHAHTGVQTSAAFDEGGARGLLLNQLGVSTTGQLIFDSTDTVGTAGSDQAAVVDSSESQDAIAGLESLIQPAGASALESAQLCPAFSAFVAANWEGTCAERGFAVFYGLVLDSLACLPHHAIFTQPLTITPPLHHHFL